MTRRDAERRRTNGRTTRAAWTLTLRLLALAMLVTACGSDGPTATSGEPGGASKSGAATLRIAFVPATTALPLHVAETQRIFDRNGLNVTLTQAANISDIPATLGRQFDIALGTATDLIRAGAAGVDVVQIAGNTLSTKDNPFVQLIARPDSGIEDVGQLEGKTVGTPTLSGVIHAAVQYWAKKEGADPTAIKAVEAPSPVLPDQLKAKRLDAVEALEPFASELRAAGNVTLGEPFSSIADPLSTNFWMAQGRWARANSDVLARFVDSLEEARSFIDQNAAEARRILQGYTGMPAPVAEKVPLPTYDFAIRGQDLEKWKAVLNEIGQVDAEVDTRKLVLAGT